MVPWGAIVNFTFKISLHRAEQRRLKLILIELAELKRTNPIEYEKFLREGKILVIFDNIRKFIIFATAIAIGYNYYDSNKPDTIVNAIIAFVISLIILDIIYTIIEWIYYILKSLIMPITAPLINKKVDVNKIAATCNYCGKLFHYIWVCPNGHRYCRYCSCINCHKEPCNAGIRTEVINDPKQKSHGDCPYPPICKACKSPLSRLKTNYTVPK